MRLLGKVALGGGLASAATATWLVAAGVFATSATLVALDPVAPQAQANTKPLIAFDSCSALLDWYVSNAVKDVGPYGWNDGGRYYGRDKLLSGGPWAGAYIVNDLSATSGTIDRRAAVPQSDTGTNTQEAAVDEPDIAKTNGTLVARIVDDKTLVLVDVTGAEPRVTGRLALPRSGYSAELLLVGNHVLVTQQTFIRPEQQPLNGASLRRYLPGKGATRLFDIDITDPTHPQVVSRDRYNGDLLSARQYGDTIRLVTSTKRPELDWYQPSAKLSRREATRLNKDLVRSTPIERWMPSAMRKGVRGNLTTCENVLHPKEYAGNETIAITTFTAQQTDQRTTVALTAGGGIVYSSTDRLYVTTTDRRDLNPGLDRRVAVPHTDPTTSIHAFDLTGAETTYLGSGDLDGYLRDRWSLDERDGRLRVAWSKSGTRGRTDNGISIFTERDGALVPTASIGNLGIDEELQSVRWFDDLAVLVTFRQVDPLYTIDLTDQDHPVLVGKLKIPGYSGYLHPIGNDLLLGLGMAGDARGVTSGAQAAVFDISNLKKPVQVSHTEFGPDTYLQALEDPRAFAWVPSTSTAVTPLSSWSNGSMRMLSLQVSATGKLTTRTLCGLNDSWQVRSFALPDGRIAVLDGHRVRLFPGQP